MIKLYANPYDITAHGWYFSTAEDFEKKFKKHLPVEEYEIDFIDGSDEAAALFKILKVNQANLAEFFDRLDDFEALAEHDQAALHYIMEENPFTDDLDKALKLVDDEVRVMEGTAKDYAYAYIESAGGIPKTLTDAYFDYEAFGRDVKYDLDPDTHADQARLDMDDADLGEEMLRDMYGREIPADLVERYFDYDAFARDLKLNGDVHEFRFRGTRWVTDYNG
jgi:antirestriction protein